MSLQEIREERGLTRKRVEELAQELTGDLMLPDDHQVNEYSLIALERPDRFPGRAILTKICTLARIYRRPVQDLVDVMAHPAVVTPPLGEPERGQLTWEVGDHLAIVRGTTGRWNWRVAHVSDQLNDSCIAAGRCETFRGAVRYCELALEAMT